MFSDTDFAHMQRALTLAARGLYTTTPNPRVGCVLVKNGMPIGEGFTQPAGQDHAEIQALKDARRRGNDPRGATAYVTLEPCSHFGRTPPCVHARVDAAWRMPDEWTRMSILNVARCGRFSSDRSVREYAERIWKL